MSDDLDWGAATDEAHESRKHQDRHQLRKTPLHPADVSDSLLRARIDMERLVDQAEQRGDVGGADAWRIALDAIEHADRVTSEMRTKQDWSKRRG